MAAVDLVVEHPVARIELEAPARRTHITPATIDAVAEAVEQIESETEVRAILLASRGPGFCAGFDTSSLMSRLPVRPDGQPDGALRARFQTQLESMQRAVSRLERCRVPVIAVVDGECGGAGLALALACDLRFCTHAATFAVREIQMAMVPDLGTLQRLPALVGHGLARELVLTARDVDGVEAQRIGLVNRSLNDRAELETTAGDVAAAIAGNAPLAVQGAKAVMNEALREETDRGLRFVATWNAAHLVSQDLGMAIAAAVTGDPPEWGGR